MTRPIPWHTRPQEPIYLPPREPSIAWDMGRTAATMAAIFGFCALAEGIGWWAIAVLVGLLVAGLAWAIIRGGTR